jgi:hypothetical protein
MSGKETAAERGKTSSKRSKQLSKKAVLKARFDFDDADEESSGSAQPRGGDGSEQHVGVCFFVVLCV